MKASGHFFRELSSKKEAGEIELINRTATIMTHELQVCEKVEIQSIQSKKDIYLSNGYLFILSVPLTSEQETHYLNKFKKVINWLEIFSFKRSLILSLILILGLTLIRFTLISTAHVTVAVFPKAWEEQIGNNTYLTLEKLVLKETELTSDRIYGLRKKTAKIIASNKLRESNIFFHKSEFIGPNALAFPGGPIVVTDELVELLNDDKLILAVIAHELAHVEQRHSLHQIVEIVGIAALASVLLGSNDTLIEEFSAVALNLWASKKSREFEKDADLIALSYLANTDLEKKSFALAIEKLINYFCEVTPILRADDCIKESGGSWFASHPSGAERLKYLQSPNSD